MLTPGIVNIVFFFYLIGNTPAVCLLQDLPCEQEAYILLVGCRDVRNILFTTYTLSARQLLIMVVKYQLLERETRNPLFILQTNQADKDPAFPSWVPNYTRVTTVRTIFYLLGWRQPPLHRRRRQFRMDLSRPP